MKFKLLGPLSRLTQAPEKKPIPAPRFRFNLDARGLKRWYVPGSEFEGKGTLTPYAGKELRRRRRASKLAKQSRAAQQRAMRSTRSGRQKKHRRAA